MARVGMARFALLAVGCIMMVTMLAASVLWNFEGKAALTIRHTQMLENTLAVKGDELTPVLTQAVKVDAHSENVRARRRMGVCIVGNADRIELDSKFEHFVKPMLRRYEKVDLLLLSMRHENTHLKDEFTEAENRTLERASMLHPDSHGSVSMSLAPASRSALLFNDEVANGSAISSAESWAVAPRVEHWSQSMLCFLALLGRESELSERFSAVARFDGSAKLAPSKRLAQVQRALASGAIVDARRCEPWLGFGDSAAVASRDAGRAALLSGFWGFYLWPERVGISLNASAIPSNFPAHSASVLHDVTFTDIC